MQLQGIIHQPEPPQLSILSHRCFTFLRTLKGKILHLISACGQPNPQSKVFNSPLSLSLSLSLFLNVFVPCSLMTQIFLAMDIPRFAGTLHLVRHSGMPTQVVWPCMSANQISGPSASGPIGPSCAPANTSSGLLGTASQVPPNPSANIPTNSP